MGEGHRGLKLYDRLSKEELIILFRTYRGNITKVAQHIKCSRNTLTMYVNQDEDLKEELQESRQAFVNELLVESENVLLACIKDVKDKPNALKAAFFILNNLGKKIGYNQLGIDTENGTKVAGTLAMVTGVKLSEESDEDAS